MTVSTIKSSGGDYTTLSAWEAAQAATLTATAEAECYDFDLDDTLAISGITTSATNYLNIYAATGCQHDGRSRTVSGTGFRLKRTAAGGIALSVNCNHLRVTGIEIEGASSTTTAVSYLSGTFAAGANDHRFENCIIHDTITGTGYTCALTVANLVLTMRNTIVYGYQRTWDTRNAASITSENNTFWRHAAQLGLVSDTELVCKNTYSGHTGAAAEDFYTGAAAPSGNNNISSDTSQATDYTSGISSIAGSAVFTSVTAGSEDFALKAGTNALVDAGATLSVATDIIGTARPQGASWDVGAFERIVSGATYTLTAAFGSFALTGNAAGLKVSRNLSASVGSFALTGNAAALLFTRKLAAGTGSFALSGNSAGLVASRKLAPSVATFALTGNDAALTAARKLSAASGSYALTGNAANLVYTPTGGATYTLSAGIGSFALTGNAASLKAARSMSAGAGNFNVTGNAAGLVFTRKLAASSGVFSLAGSDALLRASRCLSAGVGAYVLTGHPVTFTASSEVTYSRAPSGSGYAPQHVERQSRAASGNQTRPASTQRNSR